MIYHIFGEFDSYSQVGIGIFKGGGLSICESLAKFINVLDNSQFSS